MKELTLDATLENMETVQEFVRGCLENAKCSTKIITQVNIAVEEIYVNIAHYAYKTDKGTATIRIEVMKEPLTAVITFIDQGIPYNPLAKEDPDVSLSAEERKIGGLGIYMVKKSMDDVSYEYKDGNNILYIKKYIGVN
jgi:anti-sigma regulatory factor (Ser/Thr protein kinase)